MTGKNDLITMGLAGVRVLVKPVYGDLLAQWIAGYGDSGLPSEAPQIVVSMTPDDIADAREKTLRWRRAPPLPQSRTAALQRAQ